MKKYHMTILVVDTFLRVSVLILLGWKIALGLFLWEIAHNIERHNKTNRSI